MKKKRSSIKVSNMPCQSWRALRLRRGEPVKSKIMWRLCRLTHSLTHHTLIHQPFLLQGISQITPQLLIIRNTAILSLIHPCVGRCSTGVGSRRDVFCHALAYDTYICILFYGETRATLPELVTRAYQLRNGETTMCIMQQARNNNAL